MTFIEKIKLAFYNLAHRKKTTAQCVLMMSFIMVLIFVSSFFIATLTIQLSDGLDNYAAKNYITIRHYSYDDYSQLDNVLLNEKQQKDFKKKFGSVDEINYYKNPRFYIEHNPIFPNWIVNGVVYESKLNNDKLNNDSFTIFDGDYPIWWEIVSKELNAPTFSKNMHTEFSKKFPNEELIKYGKDIQNEDEILIPEEYLEFFEITPEQLLNANITIENVLKDAKVAGITNSKISMMYPDKEGNRNQYEEIYTYTGMKVLFYTNPFEELQSKVPEFEYASYTFQRIELKNSTEVESIIEYLEDIFGEDYWVQYANQSKFNEIDTINKILIFVWNIIIVLVFVLGVGLIVFLYSVMEHSAKQKGSYFGIMRAMGEKNTLSITIIETVILTVFAAVICLIISSIAAFSLGGTIIGISWSTRYEFIINKGLFALVFFITLLAVAALNIFVALLSSRHQSKKSITEALKDVS